MAISTLHLPDACGTILTSRSQIAPIWAECDCAYSPLVSQTPSNDLPHATAAILTCSCQVAPIRTERDITYVVPRTVVDVFMRQANEPVTVLCLPDAYCMVSAGCSQVAPIWSEDNGIYAPLVIHMCDLPTTTCLPYASCMILACRSQVKPIWTERQGRYTSLVIQAGDLARTCRFPYASSAIHTCCSKVTAI